MEQRAWITGLDQVVQTIGTQRKQGKLYVLGNKKTLLGPVQRIIELIISFLLSSENLQRDNLMPKPIRNFYHYYCQ